MGGASCLRAIADPVPTPVTGGRAIEEAMHYPAILALLAAVATLCLCVVGSVMGLLTAILDEDRRAQAVGVAAGVLGFAGAISALFAISHLVLG